MGAGTRWSLQAYHGERANVGSQSQYFPDRHVASPLAMTGFVLAFFVFLSDCLAELTLRLFGTAALRVGIAAGINGRRCAGARGNA